MLPPKVRKAFTKLAEGQRNGPPEKIMLQIQFHCPGILSPLVEHIGDLTHRMVDTLDSEGCGFDLIKDKVDRSIRYLRYGYGWGKSFLKEYETNIQNNFRTKNDATTLEQYRAKLNRLLRAYAQAHSDLSVYNHTQLLANKAAIAIGLQKFDLALRFLEELRQSLSDRSKWCELASAYFLDPNGDPIKLDNKFDED